jgi:predicted lipase
LVACFDNFGSRHKFFRMATYKIPRHLSVRIGFRTGYKLLVCGETGEGTTVVLGVGLNVIIVPARLSITTVHAMGLLTYHPMQYPL